MRVFSGSGDAFSYFTCTYRGDNTKAAQKANTALNLIIQVNIFKKIVTFFSVSRESSGAASSAPGGLPYNIRNVYGYGGSRVSVRTADGAMCLSTVYSCVQYISNAVANMRCMYQKRNSDGVFNEDYKSNLHYLLTVQPNDDYNAHDFWHRAVSLILLRGNAYILPVWDVYTGQLDKLVLLEDGAVFYDRYSRVYTVNDTENAISGRYNEDEIIHLKNIVTDGKEGLSVIDFAMQNMGIVATAKREIQNRFANGGNVRGFVGNIKGVKGMGQYQKSELSDLAVDVDSQFSSGKHIVSLPGDAQFTPVSLSSTDMQFLETYKFSTKELCQFFGVPTVLITGESSSAYKSLTEARLAFMSQTLDPLLKRIENEFKRKLIDGKMCGKRRFLFDRSAIYDTDLLSKAKYQLQTIQTGIYTINEWRRMENRPTIENGDTPLVSANLKGLQQLLSEEREVKSEESNTGDPKDEDPNNPDDLDDPDDNDDNKDKDNDNE